MQEIAAAVEKETNIRLLVYGFDTGGGLPETKGDFRDHPVGWKAGAYPMGDPIALKTRPASRTTLILGDVRETVPIFVEGQRSPVGFVSFDPDLYSSTRDALRIFTLPGKRMLLHTPTYFDDISHVHNNRFAGELLAIDEFNASSKAVKIDRWRGLAKERAFSENGWLTRMYVAHDFEGIAKAS